MCPVSNLSTGQKYSKNYFLNLDHVSMGPLLVSSLSTLTRVHLVLSTKKKIALTLTFSESSPSNKFSTILKNDRVASSFRLTPPEKVGGCTLLWMSCKRLFLHVYIYSLFILFVSFHFLFWWRRWSFWGKIRRSSYLFIYLFSYISVSP